VLLALVLFGGAYALVQPNQSANAQAPEAADIQAGRSLFVSAGCVTCHGLNADGVKDKGPTLIGVGAASVDFQVGTGRMPLAQPGQQAEPRKPVFTDTEISQLANYVASLAPGSAIPSADQVDASNLSDANLAQGGDLFRTNCAGCHNFAGKGGALPDGARAPALTDTTATHIYEAMLTGRSDAGVRRHDHYAGRQAEDHRLHRACPHRRQHRRLCPRQLGPGDRRLVGLDRGHGLAGFDRRLAGGQRGACQVSDLEQVPAVNS